MKIVIISEWRHRMAGKYNIWCMDNPVFDLIIGKASEARKPYDTNPEWEAVLALGTRQQRLEGATPHPSLKVPDIVVDDIQPDDNYREQEVDLTLSVICENV